MNMKKILALLLVSALFIPLFGVSTSALIINDGDFGYELNTSSHTAALVRYYGDGTRVEIPSYFQGYPVTYIDSSAFSGKDNIKEVVFSETVTSVDKYAFMNCVSLESVTIPANVVDFGDRVFAGCTSLKTVELLSDITKMPTNMFSGCSSLTDLTINPKIGEFSYGCFNGCSSLTDLSFVSGGAVIGNYAFNSTGAESVVLSDSLIAIPDYAFTNCPNLKYVTIPASVIFIQPNAFDFSNITIRCYYDSMAYIFAAENEIPYELLDGLLLGDTDGDGDITSLDVTMIQRYEALMDVPTTLLQYPADVDEDGEVTIADATYIQRFMAYMETPYKIGEKFVIPE